MIDCLSCKHAEPACAPDGSVDFRIKNCKRFPPTPVILMGPNGPGVSAMFPTVGAGVRCGEWTSKLSITEQLADMVKPHPYARANSNGRDICAVCGLGEFAPLHGCAATGVLSE